MFHCTLRRKLVTSCCTLHVHSSALAGNLAQHSLHLTGKTGKSGSLQGAAALHQELSASCCMLYAQCSAANKARPA